MQKKVFSNVFFSIVDKALVFIFNMTVSVMVARYLGATDYGKYTYFSVVYSFVNSFASFGMAQIVTKEFAACKIRQGPVFYAAILVAFLAGFITEFGVVVLQAVTGFLSWLEVVALGIICFFSVCSVFQYYLVATYQLNYVVKIKNFLAVLVVTIYILLIAGKASVEWFIWAFTVRECCALSSSFLAFLCLKKRAKFKIQPVSTSEVFPIIKKVIRLCLPLLLSSLSVTLYLKIDQVMIRSMISEEQLGIYSSGVKLVEAFYFIPSAITTGMLPYFTEQYVRKEQTFWKQFGYLASGLNVVAYFFVITMVLFGKWIIYLLYGEEYAGAADVMLVSVWTVIPVCMGCARGIYLSIKEYSGLSFLFSISAAMVNIGMNYFLIHLLGIVGASVASVISYFIQGFILTFISPKLKSMAKIQVMSFYGFIFLLREGKEFIKQRRSAEK